MNIDGTEYTDVHVRSVYQLGGDEDEIASFRVDEIDDCIDDSDVFFEYGVYGYVGQALMYIEGGFSEEVEAIEYIEKQGE